MKKLSVISIILVALFCLYSLSGAQDCNIRVIPSQSGPLGIGENVDLQVRVENYTDLLGINMTLLFNKAVLQPRSPAVSQGTIFSPFLHMFFPTVYSNSIKVDDALAQSVGISGSDGLALTLHFQTVGVGCTDIAIQTSRLRNSQNVGIPHSSYDGVVTVNSPLPDNSHTELFDGLENPDERIFGNTKAKMDFNYTSLGGTVTIAHYENEPPGGNFAPFNPDPIGYIQNPVVGDRYWEITSSMANTGTNKYSANVTFSYAGLAGVENPLRLRVAKRGLAAGPADTWDILAPGYVDVFESTQEIVISGPLNSELFTTGQYAIISDAGDNALPVNLTSFSARMLSASEVKLKWSTESEVNNHGFFIERIKPGFSEFQLLPEAFIPGAGNSSEPQLYEFIDRHVFPGIWNYRLKQVDANGDENYIGEVSLTVTENGGENTEISSYILHPNYPNPFNPSTTLEFEIREKNSENIRLAIFDNLGREVKTLMNAPLSPGRYSVKWDGHDAKGHVAQSGMYFCHLIGENVFLTRKIMLLR